MKPNIFIVDDFTVKKTKNIVKIYHILIQKKFIYKNN